MRHEKKKTDQEERKRAKELGVGLPWRFALELSKVMTQDRHAAPKPSQDRRRDSTQQIEPREARMRDKRGC